MLWLYLTSMFPQPGSYTLITVLHTYTQWMCFVSAVFPYWSINTQKPCTSFCFNTRFKYYRGFPVEHFFFCTQSVCPNPLRLLVDFWFHMCFHFFFFSSSVCWLMMMISLGFSFSFWNSCVLLLESSINAGVMQPFLESLASQVICVACIIWSGTRLICSQLHSELLGACCALLCLLASFRVCSVCSWTFYATKKS